MDLCSDGEEDLIDLLGDETALIAALRGRALVRPATEPLISLLHQAAATVSPQTLEAILNAGGRDFIDFPMMSVLRWTPLHFAANEERIDNVGVLLDNGADVNAHDPDVISEPPLNEFIGKASEELVDVLLRAGADPRIEGWMRHTALTRAEKRLRERPNDEARRIVERLRRWSP